MLNNLKVRTKIVTMVLFIGVLFFIIGSMMYVNIRRLKSGLDSMYNNNLVSIQSLNDARAQQRAVEADIYYIMLHTNDKEAQNKKLKDIEERKEKFNKSIETYKKTELDKYETDLLPVKIFKIYFRLQQNRRIFCRHLIRCKNKSSRAI